MAEVDINIAGRQYRVACRSGEEENLRQAAALVDAKSREALAGLGTLSEARQLLFASLLLADQMLEGPENTRGPSAPSLDPALSGRVESLADRLERLAARVEEAGRQS